MSASSSRRAQRPLPNRADATQIPLDGLSQKELTDSVNEARVMSRIAFVALRVRMSPISARCFRHPHIISYMDSFIEDNMLNIVMVVVSCQSAVVMGVQEYADCGDLAQRIKAHRERPMPEDLIWHYAIQMCQARTHAAPSPSLTARRGLPICTSAACCTATSSRRTYSSTRETM